MMPKIHGESLFNEQKKKKKRHWRKENFILLKTISNVPYFPFFVFLQRLLVAGHPKTATQKKECRRVKLNA